MKNSIKIAKLLVWVLVSFTHEFGFGVRDLVDFAALNWALRASSDQRPTLSAILVYHADQMEPADVKRLLGVFNKASHNHVYRNHVEFLELNLDTWQASEQGRLIRFLELPNFEQAPFVMLFKNGAFLDLLTGAKLTKFRNLVNFVANGFKTEISKLKHFKEAQDESILRYQEYPPYYYGASFGEPFYSSYAGRQFYGGYYYPYNYSIYFNTAFFTSMAI